MLEDKSNNVLYYIIITWSIKELQLQIYNSMDILIVTTNVGSLFSKLWANSIPLVFENENKFTFD
jgi:hypothetical protein